MSSSNKKRKYKGKAPKLNEAAETTDASPVDITTISEAGDNADSYIGHTSIGSHIAKSGYSADEASSAAGVAAVPTSASAEAQIKLVTEDATPVNSESSNINDKGTAIEIISGASLAVAASGGQETAVPIPAAANVKEKDKKFELLRSGEVFSMQPSKKSEQLSLGRKAGAVKRLAGLLPFMARVVLEMGCGYAQEALQGVKSMMAMSSVGEKLLSVVDYLLSLHVKATCKGSK